MKIGIIQGRLSKPDNGFQDCPEDWEREFKLLWLLKMNHVEWIVTKESFNNNPIFTENLANHPIHSICADNIVDQRIVERSYFFDNLNPICESAIKNKIENITIPLLEDSDVSDDLIRKQFCTYAKELATSYKDLNFSIEAELEPYKLIDILRLKDNFYVTYDTGNMTSCKIDHKDYIHEFKDRINNVHLKDRTFDAQTVSPTTGDTDFKTIFNNLHKVNYSGVYTLQTAREEYGSEVETIAKHKKLFQEIYNEYTRHV